MDFSEFKPKKLDKSKNLLIYRTGPYCKRSMDGITSWFIHLNFELDYALLFENINEAATRLWQITDLVEVLNTEGITLPIKPFYGGYFNSDDHDQENGGGGGSSSYASAIDDNNYYIPESGIIPFMLGNSTLC